MVFMTMSEDDGCDMFAVLLKKIEVRNTNVNAIGALFRKSHAGVKDEHLIRITHGHAIHPKLTDTAERNDL
jgi:hypothetical protein